MTRVSLKPRAAVAPALPLTHYATLGVAPGADTATIHAAYRALAFKLHPDRNGDVERFKTVALAWGVLKNEEARKRYDAALRLQRRACTECAGSGLIKKSSGFTTVKQVICKACAGAGYA